MAILHHSRLWQALAICIFLNASMTRLAAQTPYPGNLDMTLYSGLMVSKSQHIVPGHPGFLHAESKINSVDYKDSLCQFTLALIDYDGDGVFSQPGVDRLALTIYQDRMLRVNNGYGTACMTLTESDPVIFIDSTGFAVTEIAENGSSVRLKRIETAWMSTAGLRIETWLPNATVETFFSKKLKFSDFLHRGKSVYIYFFNSRPLEYQLKKLDQIYSKYADKVSVIGLYLPFSEPSDAEITSDFLARMANPWPQGICTHELYMQLQQDMAYYRGILADESGRIREISISPKELLEKLESLYGIR